jgi:apolipoprotein N-acyltransferase
VVRERLKKIFPSWQNALLALLAAGLLILAFPDFEWWWTAWFALVPLMWSIESEKASAWRSFLLGWLFGTAFFFGTCWWLTYAPIHYAAVPWPLAYLLIFVACLLSGLFPALFAATLARLLKHFGTWAFLATPLVWVCTEFARYWLTGNNWNALGYSQAFGGFPGAILVSASQWGGILFSGFYLALFNTLFCVALFALSKLEMRSFRDRAAIAGVLTACVPFSFATLMFWDLVHLEHHSGGGIPVAELVALQPNVPMHGVDQTEWHRLRQRQIDIFESEIRWLRTTNNEQPTIVAFPESPMNFAYDDDREFHKFINDFAARNNVSVLFNSSEPDKTNGKYFNSAVMIGPDGKVAAEYDKIYLLPFGEAVPFPFEGLMPAFVGSFSYGSKYDLVPLGDAKAGVMICFESHFGELSRRYVQGGADAIIEMTNDGYLGPTPVLRQHLANAVFRAVETNCPVLRVTNVGITAYITPTGEVLDPLPAYQEGTRVWSVSKSDGSQTFYVRYGDWFAWLCVIVTVGFVVMSFRRRSSGITDR